MDKPKVVDVKDASREEAVEEELPLHERKPRVVQAEKPGEEIPVGVPVDVPVELPSSEPAVVKEEKEEKPAGVEKTEPAPFVGPALERKDGVVQPPSARPIEVVDPSSAPVPLSGKVPPWVSRTQKKPTVREVVDLADLTPPERDVIQEYRNQASREILPSQPQVGKPLTLEGERERAKRLASQITEKKQGESLFGKIRKRLFG